MNESAKAPKVWVRFLWRWAGTNRKGGICFYIKLVTRFNPQTKAIPLVGYTSVVEIKLLLGITATVFITGAFYPYIRDIFAGKTKPHIYTWLIWSITQGTAVAALIYGNGGTFAALGIGSGAFLTMIIFLLSFRYGTKKITLVDTLMLAAALLAIIVWWQLDNPTLAVLMLATIDGLGYFPTYRKSWSEPWTETLSFWYLFTAGNIISLAVLNEFNLLTSSYVATVIVASTILIILCTIRRKDVLAPK